MIASPNRPKIVYATGTFHLFYYVFALIVIINMLRLMKHHREDIYKVYNSELKTYAFVFWFLSVYEIARWELRHQIHD